MQVSVFHLVTPWDPACGKSCYLVITSRKPCPFSQPRIRIPCLSMASVCIYFQVHQPFRLRRYSVFDTDRHYFDEYKNAEICRKVAHKCYLPANRMLLDTIRMHEGRFRISYSITGVALEQFQHIAPEVVDTFHELNKTGCVEWLDETYYHSLSFLY